MSLKVMDDFKYKSEKCNHCWPACGFTTVGEDAAMKSVRIINPFIAVESFFSSTLCVSIYTGKISRHRLLRRR